MLSVSATISTSVVSYIFLLALTSVNSSPPNGNRRGSYNIIQNSTSEFSFEGLSKILPASVKPSDESVNENLDSDHLILSGESNEIKLVSANFTHKFLSLISTVEDSEDGAGYSQIMEFDASFPEIGLFYVLKNTTFSTSYRIILLNSNVNESCTFCSHTENALYHTVYEGTEKLSNLKIVGSPVPALFFLENSRRVKQINLSPSSTPSSPKTVLTSKSQIVSLSAHYDQSFGNFRLYYSVWSPSPSIYKCDLKENEWPRKLDIGRRLHFPTQLSMGSKSLFFVDNPPGVKFTVSKVDVSMGVIKSPAEVVVTGEYLHPTSLHSMCNDSILFWMDKNTKTIYLKISEEPIKKYDRIYRSEQPMIQIYNFMQRKAEEKFCLSLKLRFLPLDAPSPTNVIKETDFNGDKDQTNLFKKNISSSMAKLSNKDISVSPSQLNILEQDGISKQLSQNTATDVILQNAHSALNDRRKTDASYFYEYLSLMLSIVVAVLLLVVIFLLVKVHTLSSKPKVHRRIVLSRNKQGERQQDAQVLCEMIDIENCCNSCDKPCYEKAIATSSAGSKVAPKRSKGMSTNSCYDDKAFLISES